MLIRPGVRAGNSVISASLPVVCRHDERAGSTLRECCLNVVCWLCTAVLFSEEVSL